MYPYLIIIVLVGPVILAIGITVALKFWETHSGKRSPLNQKRLHLPGEQLRNRIDDLTNSINDYLMLLIVVGPLSLLISLYLKVEKVQVRITVIDFLLATIAVLVICYAIRELLKIIRLRRLAREGLAAELITAQNLLPLVSSGCLVFNDIPAKSEGPRGKSFNIDHVVIGANAVFMVETKSHKKPGKLDDSWKVLYDGSVLKFPDYRDTAMLEQAKRQAKWLSAYLTRATGESVKIVPVVALPGWFVETTQANAHARVIVTNCRNPRFMLNENYGPSLDSAKKQRIAHAITQLYPDLSI